MSSQHLRNPLGQPRVSIGLPVYNAEAYLSQAIEAHLGQTFGDFELVISDNASTDATIDICLSYASRDRRIRLHRMPENRGLNRNHREVFELARGALFRWSAADDIPEPRLVELMVRELERRPELVGCMPTVVNIDGEGKRLAARTETLDLCSDDALARARSVLTDSYQMTFLQGLMRRTVLSSTSMRWSFIGYDFILLLELALRGKLTRLADAVLYRRLHDKQATRALHDAATAAQFEPKAQVRVAFPQWRWTLERLRATSSAPLPARQRVAVLSLVARHAWWSRHLLARDLGTVVRGLLHRSDVTPYRL